MEHKMEFLHRISVAREKNENAMHGVAVEMLHRIFMYRVMRLFKLSKIFKILRRQKARYKKKENTSSFCKIKQVYSHFILIAENLHNFSSIGRGQTQKHSFYNVCKKYSSQ